MVSGKHSPFEHGQRRPGGGVPRNHCAILPGIRDHSGGAAHQRRPGFELAYTDVNPDASVGHADRARRRSPHANEATADRYAGSHQGTRGAHGCAHHGAGNADRSAHSDDGGAFTDDWVDSYPDGDDCTADAHGDANCADGHANDGDGSHRDADTCSGWRVDPHVSRDAHGIADGDLGFSRG